VRVNTRYITPPKIHPLILSVVSNVLSTVLKKANVILLPKSKDESDPPKRSPLLSKSNRWEISSLTPSQAGRLYQNDRKASPQYVIP